MNLLPVLEPLGDILLEILVHTVVFISIGVFCNYI